MSYLLDVNFLIALFDPRHVNHEVAHHWFGHTAASRWATCSVTENGCVRILSNPSYRTVSATPQEVMARLQRFCDSGGHSFWPDDVALRSALDRTVKDRLQGYRQVTDYHLAALSDARGGRLATFDGRLARSLDGTRLAKVVALVQRP